MNRSMKLLALSLVFLPVMASASVRVFNTSGTELGNFNDVKTGNGLTVTKTAGKALVSLFSTQSSVSGDLSATKCGMTITSDATDDYNLPAITSSILGCRFTFIVGGAAGKVLRVNPADANQILLLTNAAGDSVTADNAGESLTLEAIQPGWAPVGAEKGTWTDSN